ncbi:MAG: glycosyltransferase, partial [Prevotella sp.]|nr:glycosyltransferase [Prevotella sp.]
MVEQYDMIIIIVSAVILALSLLSPLVNIFFRSRKLNLTEEEEETGTVTDEQATAPPPLSVIITPHDNARDLEQNLPLILEQDYPAAYEVIVVVSKGEDDTDDVLKRLQSKYQHLYVTFIPDSSRYMSRKKLAVTLGVKAAHHAWICMTEPTSQPSSKNWLRRMAQGCTEENDMVVGYTNYDDNTSAYKRFETLYNQLYLFRSALKGTAYRHA